MATGISIYIFRECFRFKIIICAMVLLFGEGCRHPQVISPESRNATTPRQADWHQIAVNDLQAIHQHTVESHPGYVDPENPQFVEVADEALREALALSEHVTDELSFAAVLRAYTAAFRDGHFSAYALRDRIGDSSDSYRWPGIFLAWRNDKIFATYSIDDPSLVGATLQSCDGAQARELVLANVFRFDTGKPTQPAYWARLTPRLFVDDGNPLITIPSKCIFTLSPGGAERSVSLSWRPLERSLYRTMARHAQFGPTPLPGVREFGPDRYWINLPDFQPSGESFTNMTKLIEDLAVLRGKLRTAEVLVFDMRGNQGGSSAWGVRTIDAIWGSDYRRSRQHRQAVHVDWRISDGNIEHAAQLVRMLEDQGADDVLPGVRLVAEGLASASENQDYHRVSDIAPSDTVAIIVNPVRASVLLLTHGYCASACLDFVDQMVALENVTHIGYPTRSDTNYLEVRLVKLPSGLAGLALPVKVYRGRPRASGAYYSPTYRYDALDWSDEGIESWVTNEVLPAMSSAQ
ncbi:MAG: hypothetical protein KTR25_20680 [Myxococcales bacterium]|nr:hypothetical protein [Myxococcales bacterium]